MIGAAQKQADPVEAMTALILRERAAKQNDELARVRDFVTFVDSRLDPVLHADSKSRSIPSTTPSEALFQRNSRTDEAAEHALEGHPGDGARASLTNIAEVIAIQGA